MIALLLVAFGLGGGTVHIDGGFTNSERAVVLPTPPLGATRVRLRVDHDTLIRHGWETDGDGVSSWSVDAWISAGWDLRVQQSGHLLSRRVSQITHAAGTCVPFDGSLDYAGFSGGSVSLLRETDGTATVPVSAVDSLSIRTHARSAWTIDLTVPPGGIFAYLTWLNESRWAADVSYEWLQ